MDGANTGFLIQFPMWSLVDVGIYKAQGIERAVGVFEGDEIGLFVALFTDADLAARFLEAVPGPLMVPVPIRTPEILAAVLRLRCGIEEGIKHVGLDVSFFPGRAPQGRFFTVSEVLDLAGH